MTMHITQSIGAMALAAALALAAPLASAGFADPLDTPAQASPLAVQGLFNGLAQAGTRIVAVGQRGHILYSDNGGQDWTQAAVPVSSDLTAVSFPTPRDGWAVGQDGVVLVTHDAGASWQLQLDGRRLGALLLAAYSGDGPAETSPETRAMLQADAQRFADEGPDKPFLDVHFQDAQQGYVVGAFNLVLHTQDGGQTWLPWLHRMHNPRALHLYAIRAVGDALYVAGEQGLLLKLDRGKQQFRALTVPYQGTLFGVVGDGAALLAYGLRGNALRSSDGGANWAPVPSGVEVTLTSSARAADGSVLIATQTGQVLASKDGGVSFAALPLTQRIPASAVLALDSHTLVIAGPRGLRRLVLPQNPEVQP